MSLTISVAQKRNEYIELASLVSALSSKRERQEEAAHALLDVVMRKLSEDSEERKAFLEGYNRNRSEFWNS